MSRSEAIQLIDLLAIIAFVVGLKRLSHPATARSGNAIAAAGMTAAVAATLADESVVTYWAIAVAIVIGSVIGAVSARAVKMTAMPQMVALFNGVGGGGAALIAIAEYDRLAPLPGQTAEGRDDRDRALARDRLHLLRGLAGGLREAAGDHRRQPDHLPAARRPSTP